MITIFDLIWTRISAGFMWIVGDGIEIVRQVSMSLSLIMVSVGVFLLIFKVKKVLKWGLVSYAASLIIPLVLIAIKESLIK